jgi:hypothetical protein
MLAAKEIFEELIAFYYTHYSGIPLLLCLVFPSGRVESPFGFAHLIFVS